MARNQQMTLYITWRRINKRQFLFFFFFPSLLYRLFFFQRGRFMYVPLVALCKSWIEYIPRFHSNWLNNCTLCWSTSCSRSLIPASRMRRLWYFYLDIPAAIQRRETLMIADAKLNEIMCYHRRSTGLTLIRGLLLYTDTSHGAWSRVKALNYVTPIRGGSPIVH